MLRTLILTVAGATLCVAAAVSHAAEPLGTLTILEGDAMVYRAAGQVMAVEGMRMQPGDIVHTAADAFAQVETGDQVVAQLGPSTRALLGAASGRQAGERSLYVLDGWAKVTRPAAAAGFEVRTPLVDLPAAESVVVLHTVPQGVALFVERGTQRLVERAGASPGPTLALKANDFYRRKAGSTGAVNPPGEMKALVQALPASFRDSLPLRTQRYRDKPVQPKAAPDFDYDAVEAWLKAEPALRKAMVQRWRGKARNPAFRSALIANLQQHPEWDPVLYPEKYLPKPASHARGATAAAR